MASLHAEHVAGEQGSGSGEWSMAGSRQHSLFKRLSNMGGEVNAMTVFEIKKKLQALTLSSRYRSLHKIRACCFCMSHTQELLSMRA